MLKAARKQFEQAEIFCKRSHQEEVDKTQHGGSSRLDEVDNTDHIAENCGGSSQEVNVDKTDRGGDVGDDSAIELDTAEAVD